MWQLKKLNSDQTKMVGKLKTQVLTKLKNLNCYKTKKKKNSNCDKDQKFKLWQNLKIQIATIQLKLWEKKLIGDKIYIMTKLQTQKF